MKRLYYIIAGWFQVQTVPECFSSSSWQSADQAILWRTQPFNIKQELFETDRNGNIINKYCLPPFDILVTTMPNHRGQWRGRIATPGSDQGPSNQLTWGEVHLNIFIPSNQLNSSTLICYTPLYSTVMHTTWLYSTSILISVSRTILYLTSI